MLSSIGGGGGYAHVGLQVLSTRHCRLWGLTGKNIMCMTRHMLPLWIIFMEWRLCVSMQACILCPPYVCSARCLHASLMSSLVFVGAVDISFDLIWLDSNGFIRDPGATRGEGRTHKANAYSSIHGSNRSKGRHAYKNMCPPKHKHTREAYSAFFKAQRIVG